MRDRRRKGRVRYVMKTDDEIEQELDFLFEKLDSVMDTLMLVCAILAVTVILTMWLLVEVV